MVTSLACYAAIAIDKSLTIDDGIHSMMAEQLAAYSRSLLQVQ